MVTMNMQPVAKGAVDTFVSHNGKSTIDYIAVSSYLSGGIKACHVKGWHPLNTSNHRVIHMTLPVNGLTAMPNETNRNSFWRLVKRCRNSSGTSSITIKGHDGVIVNVVDAVLEVWRSHFANLGTPKAKANFDDQHFRLISEFVRLQNEGRGLDDEFLNIPFSIEDIRTAINNLNRGKAAGYDRVSAEHIVFAGECMENVLFLLYNAIIDLEYIPVCFRSPNTPFQGKRSGRPRS